MNFNRYAWTLAASAIALTGCGGSNSSGVLNQPLPRVRVVNALDGVATVDVTSGSTTVATGLAYGTESAPYAITTRGQQTISFTDPAAPIPPITTSPRLFTFKDRVNAIAYKNAGTPTVIQLNDNLANAPGGSISTRFVDAASQQASIDVYFTSVGGPLVNPSTMTPGAVVPGQGTGVTGSAYTTVPLANATQFEIRAFPSGTTTGALLDQTLTISPTDRWTFIIVDPNGGGNYILIPVQDNNSA